jgi:MYXO-CTERM domain-containing protein
MSTLSWLRREAEKFSPVASVAEDIFGGGDDSASPPTELRVILGPWWLWVAALYLLARRRR